MKLRSVIKKWGFLIWADGELKVAKEVFAVSHFLNGFCDLQ
jgi:hypothetical protein